MNRTLLTFGVLLILLGIGFGIYTVSLFGALLLIPALLPGSRPPARRVPEPPKHETRRITPPPVQTPKHAGEAPPSMSAPTAQLPQAQSYALPLFAAPMFPSLATMGGPPPMPNEPQEKKPEGRDELIEAGAILALLKLALG